MNQKLELQILSTGHFAPWGDEDIAEKNRTVGMCPHQPVAHLPPLETIAAGRQIIDAGAFIGDHSMEFLKRGWKVMAFEPFFDSYVCALLNAPAANIILGALGDGRRAVLNYEHSGTNFGMRSVKFDEAGSPTITIDSLALEDCAFIKIDVEGMEPFVLNGAVETIRKFRPILFVEGNPDALARYGWTTDRLAAHIRSFAYELDFIGEHPNFDWMCSPE